MDLVGFMCIDQVSENLSEKDQTEILCASRVLLYSLFTSTNCGEKSATSKQVPSSDNKTLFIKKRLC